MADWNIPEEGYKFTKSDEWIKLEGDEALVGITDYAQDLLSDLVFVELPSVGDSFDQGEAFGAVESVKAAADVNLPVSGEIIAVHEELDDAPETLNQDPYGGGRIDRSEESDPSELDGH